MNYLRYLCLMLIGCWLTARPALAQDPPDQPAWALVEVIWELDPAGRWVEVTSSGEAELVRAGDPAPVRVLTVDMPLEPGDYLTTADARVRVRFATDEQIIIEPTSGLELGERSIFQLAGEALYEVRGIFRVTYGSVEAAVEGTRFSLYEESGEVIVSVAEGVVRVTTSGESVQVRRGEQTRAPTFSSPLPSQPPAGPAPPAPLPPEDAAAFRGLQRKLGEPRLSLALMGGGGLGLGSTRGDTRAIVRYQLFGRWRLVAETGFATDGAVFYLPQGLGVERRTGPVSLSLKGVGYIAEETNLCEDTTRIAMLPGATADLRLRFPVGPIALESQARVGWVAAPTADVAIGVSFAR